MDIVNPDQLRMYIGIREGIDLGHAMLAVGHGVLACYLQFIDDPIMELWESHSFRKVICLLNDKEFATARQIERSLVMTESGFANAETAVVLAPRIDKEWPHVVKWWRLVNLENFTSVQLHDKGIENVENNEQNGSGN